MKLAHLIEGLLFVVGEAGASLNQLTQTLEVSETVVLTAIDELNQSYINDNRSLRLVQYGGLYKILTHVDLNPLVRRMLSLQKTRTLSQSALETLAIVAYKQPVTRVEIEEIRGVNCDLILRKLQALDLIKEAGRTDSPGRPILYEITEEFLDVFQLMSLKELPELEKLNVQLSNQLFD